VPDPKGRAKRSLPYSKHRVFSHMLAEVECSSRPPWAGMRFARNVTWKRFMADSILGSSYVLSVQLFPLAIPFCSITQASMHVEVLRLGRKFGVEGLPGRG
jgi:hypothetical protein